MKTKKYNKITNIFLIVVIVALYGFAPPVFNVGAVDTIYNASDLITDSDAGEISTHTFTFSTVSTTTINGYWDIDFPDSGTGFTTLATTSITCAYGVANFTAQLFEDQNIVRCLRTVAVHAPTSTSVVITGVTNPPATETGTKWINIYNKNSSGTVLDRVEIGIVIIEDVLMTAHVDSILTFSVTGTTTGSVIAGETCGYATATTTPWGVLEILTASTTCQSLQVTTNADDGYIVTVEQSDELTADSDANINSFDDAIDGMGSTTPVAWNSPSAVLDDEKTYGHMGLHSTDANVEDAGGPNFDSGGTYFAGLDGTNPMIVLAHGGPTAGTANDGYANVIYKVEISALQEAGDYETTLTYICTPTF